jgi:RNA polymerase sigma-70 factor (ECF subfamily)
MGEDQDVGNAQRAHLRLVRPEAPGPPEEPAPEVYDLETSEGFAAAYARWSPYVARIALNITGDSDLASEVVQEVFARAFEHRHRIEDPGVLKAWLRTTASRHCYKLVRKRKVMVTFGLVPEPTFEGLGGGGGVEDEVLLKQLFARLERVASKDRVAWSLRYLSGESLADVAQACGCSLATAKRRIKKANDFLTEEG